MRRLSFICINVVLFLFLTIIIFGCKKNASVDLFPSITSYGIKSDNKKNLTHTDMHVSTDANNLKEQEWERRLMMFYEYTENGVTKNIPELSLNHLGDLIDNNDYQTASTQYGISENNLRQIKQLAADAFIYWYTNIYDSGNSSVLSYDLQNGVMREKRGTINLLLLGDCEDIRDGCRSEALANYLFRMGECYGGTVAVGTFFTPLLGGFFVVGCGLYVNRTYTKAKIACNAEYNKCRGIPEL